MGCYLDLPFLYGLHGNPPLPTKLLLRPYTHALGSQSSFPLWPQSLISTESLIKCLQNPQQGRLAGPMDSKKPTISTWKMAMKAEEPEGKTGRVRGGSLFSLEAAGFFRSQDLQNDTFVKIMTQLGSDNWCL